MSQGNGPPAGATLTCANCGAPDAGELVVCRFCRQPVSAEAAQTAIPCPNPHCRALCRWGKQKCAQCQAWIVVSCVFCGAISPHNLPGCMQCGETFAGAPQRKALMEQQRQHQQTVEQANVWGGVAASFLGAAAGSILTNTVEYAYDGFSSVDSCSSPSVDDAFDALGSSDDDGFDVGGEDE